MTDTYYEKERNALIPQAKKFADLQHGKQHSTGKRDSWLKQWNFCFLQEMDRLAKIHIKEA